MNQLSETPLVAILVGITKYTNHPELINKTITGADDAKKLHDFLVDEMDANITLLQDSAATRGNIIKALRSLEGIARTSAILFYFSGHIGKAKLDDEDNSHIAMICPSDIGTANSGNPGISDQDLIQLFGKISMERGNNITLFLDCESDIFKWGDPSSFVIVAPARSSRTLMGGVFTDVLINLLRSEVGQKSIQMLTARSLADKIRVDMDLAVRCYGKNADHVLFNPEKGKAFHRFISGNKMRDGSMMLLAGFAQGIQKDTIYGIYASNIISDQNIDLVYLRVSSVDSATSATLSLSEGDLSPSEGDLSLPTVFYAVEVCYPGETVNVFFSDKANKIDIPSGKEVEDPNMANITLRITQDCVGFSFNGVTDDCEEMRDTDPAEFLSLPLNDPRTIKAIRSAARFMYHTSRLSPDDSSLSVSVGLQQTNGHNLLDDKLFTTLSVIKNKSCDPFYLVLHNNNPSGHALWPFVFICDVYNDFDISPFYVPPAAAEAPLKPGRHLIVGCGDPNHLWFQWHKDRKSEIFYIKIFFTTEPTSFSSLIQKFQPESSSEDRFREAYHLKQYSSTECSKEGTYDDGSEISEPGFMCNYLHGVPDWATMRVTIKVIYDQDEGTLGPICASDSAQPTEEKFAEFISRKSKTFFTKLNRANK